MILKTIGYFSICLEFSLEKDLLIKVKGPFLTLLNSQFKNFLREGPVTKVKGTKADGGYLGTQRR